MTPVRPPQPADIYPALERKYDDNQPRVPAGETGGGQWTSGSGGSGRPRVHIYRSNPEDEIGEGGDEALSLPMGSLDVDDVSNEIDKFDLFDISPRERPSSGVRLADGDDRDRPLVDLAEEEQQGGHAISKHVNRTNEYLKARVRDEAAKIIARGDSFNGLAVGSFTSVQSANRLVNSTLSRN